MKDVTDPSASSTQARYIMVGGFFGSGKTTAMVALAGLLRRKGLRVGIITNDPGTELVDTAVFRSGGFVTEEITGGCFCQRLEELAGAVNRLRHSTQPDVFLAEPVGSCTGLVPAVASPLSRMHPEFLTMSPFSVLVDPAQAESVFEPAVGGRFSKEISSLYRRQLAEADLLLINKTDLTPEPKLQRLKAALREAAPQALLLNISARSGAGLEEWLECITQHPRRPEPAVDSLSVDGDSSLGWLNCTLRLSSVKYFESSNVLIDLFGCIQSLLRQEGAELAHLKAHLDPGEDLNETAAIHLVRGDGLPELSHPLSEPIQSGELLLNLRAEADPEILHSVVTRALLTLMDRSPELFLRMEHSEHFRPGKAEPRPAVEVA